MIFGKIWLDRESLREQLKDCSAAFDRQQEQLDRNAEQNAAQLKELHRISEALGSNDGHSSVTHIEILKEENATLREALSRLIEVHDAMGGMCSPERILAEEALLGKAHKEKNGG